MEKWKDIPNYENYYQASSFGRIKSKKTNKILKQGMTKNGYLKVDLCINNNKKTFLVHRLIMKTFVGNSNLQVDHINCNKLDNTLNNLENTIRAWNNNLIKRKKNKINQYDLNGHFIKTWFNCGDIEKNLQIDHSNIIKCCKHKRNQCKGYKWEYFQEQ